MYTCKSVIVYRNLR